MDDEERYASTFAHRTHVALRERIAQPISDAVMRHTGIECFDLAIGVGMVARLLNAASVAAALTGCALTARRDPGDAAVIAAVALGIGRGLDFVVYAVTDRAGHVRERLGDDGTRAFADPAYRLQPLAMLLAGLGLFLLAMATVCATDAAARIAPHVVGGTPWSRDEIAFAAHWGLWGAAFAAGTAAMLLAACERPPRPPRRERGWRPATA